MVLKNIQHHMQYIAMAWSNAAIVVYYIGCNEGAIIWQECKV
jgi:hypothetical protein